MVRLIGVGSALVCIQQPTKSGLTSIKVSSTGTKSVGIAEALFEVKAASVIANVDKLIEDARVRALKFILFLYRFREDTGIARRTAYELYNNPTQAPHTKVLSEICDREALLQAERYEIQPEEIIEWVTPKKIVA